MTLDSDDLSNINNDNYCGSNKRCYKRFNIKITEVFFKALVTNNTLYRIILAQTIFSNFQMGQAECDMKNDEMTENCQKNSVQSMKAEDLNLT